MTEIKKNHSLQRIRLMKQAAVIRQSNGMSRHDALVTAHRETIASPVRNKSMHTEEHFVGFKAMNGSRIEKDVYLVWLYAILDCFLYVHAFIYTVYFLVCYFLTGYFPVEY